MKHPGMAAWIVSLVAAGMTAVGAQYDPFPDGPGKSELLEVCRDCHGPDIVLNTRKVQTEWAKVLRDMAALGAQGSPEQFKQIAAYLDRQFAVIKINEAGAEELRATMGVPAELAQAIVDHREAHGNFTSLDDLANVPGLAPATSEAAKDRLAFDVARGEGVVGRTERADCRRSPHDIPRQYTGTQYYTRSRQLSNVTVQLP